MSVSKIVLISAILAIVEARFGQEQIPVQAVQDLGASGFGDPGVAATIAGSIPSALLAATNPCVKLEIADQIVSQLGNDQAVIDAALGLVSAETNFNPFAVSVPFVCADASLPTTAALRGVVPLVDPAVGGSDVENANSATSVGSPFDATGLSQAEVMIAQGFSNFTAVQSDGTRVTLNGQDGAGAGAGAGNNAGNNNAGNNDNAGNDNAGNDDDAAAAPPVNCGGNNNNNNNNNGNNNNAGNGNNNNDNAGNDNNNNDNADAGNDAGNNAGAGGASDFGVCTPTIARVGGLNGRPATEFTFIPQDPLVAQGQQEALNPNIITNRICDQLTNVCNASDEAKALCKDAQAQILALGTRDQSTADTWNALLGFAGADSTVATL